ncbi:helix-turn-helix transcriptional regulator [Photobacterium angustum]|uniref:helix-turn-helix transcriptional regulator n=1 Tax=Photobacterium angustum TaxID=661 RepID=UPI00069938EA|nr:hypothetical protein [Photobacterium angustum]PSV61699.1 hypothetical protein CTM95_20570 [Photobacterium angustum]
MTTRYDFALLATFDKPVTEDILLDLSDDLISATGDDFVMTVSGGALLLDFYRESDTYRNAVASAIRDVQSVNGVTVNSVDSGQFVTLSDIGALTNLSRSTLCRYKVGNRQGSEKPFPTPRLKGNSKAPLYDWEEVAEWLEEKGLVDAGTAEQAKITAYVNTALKFKSADLASIAALEKELRNEPI